MRGERRGEREREREAEEEEEEEKEDKRKERSVDIKGVKVTQTRTIAFCCRIGQFLTSLALPAPVSRSKNNSQLDSSVKEAKSILREFARSVEMPL